MTKAAALQKFFGSFGIPAYPSNNVPDETTFPWLTYDVSFGSWGDGEIPIAVHLYYHTTFEAIPNAKAEEIGKAIGLGGVMLHCDDGAVWIKKGSPFCADGRRKTRDQAQIH